MSHIQSPDWLIRIALNKSPDKASFLRMTDLPVTSALDVSFAGVSRQV